MGCIYENNGMGSDGGLCYFHEVDGCVDDTLGMDEKGFCCVSDDPDPSYGCANYESDYTCMECGADLNVEDCGCEDE